MVQMIARIIFFSSVYRNVQSSVSLGDGLTGYDGLIRALTQARPHERLESDVHVNGTMTFKNSK